MLVGVDDEPGVVANIFGALASENISVDMIIQNVPRDLASAQGGSSKPKTDVTFTVNKTDLPRAKLVMEAVVRRVNALSVRYDESIAKVSIVGLGMRSHAGVAARMFSLLADAHINIEAISTSEIKVSCIVRLEHVEHAVRVLHDGFGLNQA